MPPPVSDLAGSGPHKDVRPRCVGHSRRRLQSRRLASQPRTTLWTLIHRFHPNPSLRTTSTQGTGSGFREGPPCSLTRRSACHHSSGYLSLKSSNHTARTIGKGLAQLARCDRMSAALNGAGARAYRQEPTRTGYNWSICATNRVVYAAQGSPACRGWHSGPVIGTPHHVRALQAKTGVDMAPRSWPMVTDRVASGEKD